MRKSRHYLLRKAGNIHGEARRTPGQSSALEEFHRHDVVEAVTRHGGGRGGKWRGSLDHRDDLLVEQLVAVTLQDAVLEHAAAAVHADGELRGAFLDLGSA